MTPGTGSVALETASVIAKSVASRRSNDTSSLSIIEVWAVHAGTLVHSYGMDLEDIRPDCTGATNLGVV